MNTKELTSTVVIDETTTDDLLGKPYNVILLNDSFNDFLSVIALVARATRCGAKKAMDITMEAHNKGQAIAFTGHREMCEQVERILSSAPCNLTTCILPV